MVQNFVIAELFEVPNTHIQFQYSEHTLGIWICAGGVLCSIEESSGPQNLRVHLVLKASKSASA